MIVHPNVFLRFLGKHVCKGLHLRYCSHFCNARIVPRAARKVTLLRKDACFCINVRCIINGNDNKYTEWSTDAKLFPLAYNSKITRTLGLSQYEMVFNQKPRKPIMFTANSSKMDKVIVKVRKIQFVTIYHYIHTMKIVFITHKF